MIILILFPIIFPSLGITHLPQPVTTPCLQVSDRMSLTLEDFLRINKENIASIEKQRVDDQRERAREREHDQHVRAKERVEDLGAISKLIESGVKDEVIRVIKPIEEKNEKRLGKLEEDMTQIKNLLTFAQLHPPQAQASSPAQVPPPAVQPPPPDAGAQALPTHTQVPPQVQVEPVNIHLLL